MLCDDFVEFAQANAVREKPRPPPNRVGDLRFSEKYCNPIRLTVRYLRHRPCPHRNDSPNRSDLTPHRLEHFPIAFFRIES